MSAGDSITAGLGARWSYSRPTLFVYEDCGVSFATGGDADIVSLAKLIETECDNEIVGKSYGSRRVGLCIDRPTNRVFCPRNPIRLRRKDDGYNVALTGATSEALPLQFTEIIKRVDEDRKIFPKDNRILLTLLIGANDLCMWDCRRPDVQIKSFQNNVVNFVENVYEFFGDRLNVLIGEIPALDGIPIRANRTLMEPFAVLECPCAYHKPVKEEYLFAERIDSYNSILRNLTQSHPAIIITRVLREEELKNWPKEMTSKLDAFHPSKWAHEYFAKKIFKKLKEL